jgi:hypothetical protein
VTTRQAPGSLRRDERVAVTACTARFGPRPTARALSRPESTLRWWASECRAGRMSPGARGPARRRATTEQRLVVRRFLADHGRHTGAPSLRAAFPLLARRELMRLKREGVRQRNLLAQRRGSRLSWRTPGAVWAADFTDLDEAAAGGEKAMLFVHDLASGCVLWARPCRRKDAAAVAEALSALIERHGAPLVFRVDNGKALHAPAVRAVLAVHGVTLLRTPNRTPSYNGSCESGLGWHKRRILDVAERGGGIGAWDAEDFETMRLRANDVRRPWGANGPSPAERFAARQPLTPEHRAAFLAAVEARREDEHLRRDPLCDGRHRAAIERAAIRRTLVDLGHLEIKPRRVSPAIHPLECAGNR